MGRKRNRKAQSAPSVKEAAFAGHELLEGERPRCLEIASAGIRTGSDFADMMSGLMSDLVEGKVTPQVGNAVCNAGGKLLKVVEMQHKYGTAKPDGQKKTLELLE